MINVAFRRYLLLLSTLLLISAPLWSQTTQYGPTTSISSASVGHFIDPDIIDSEWNHHVAGYALILSAVLYIAGLSTPRLTWARLCWIILLFAAAMFLAVWSDKEIWPRGTLNWMWLIHHDAEARQHKIYAVLLLVIAFVEYFRQSGRLTRVWSIWAFPTLAFVGACLLLMHTHDGHSGLPAGWDDAAKRTKILQMAGFGAMPMDATETSLPPKHNVDVTRIPQESQSMLMPQSQVGETKLMHAGHSGDSEHHHHLAIAATTHVEKQHLWFALVGITLALFKWVNDGQFWRSRVTTYLWPCSMLTLGVLLALYTEVK
jgi:hypothetical protein